MSSFCLNNITKTILQVPGSVATLVKDFLCSSMRHQTTANASLATLVCHCAIYSLYFTLLLTILSISSAIEPTLSPFVFEIKLSHIKSNNGHKTRVPGEKPPKARQRNNRLHPFMVLSPEFNLKKKFWMGSTDMSASLTLFMT